MNICRFFLRRVRQEAPRPSTNLLTAICAAAMAAALPLSAAEAPPVPKDVAGLLAEYQKEYSKATQPIDKVLQAEASKIAAKMVSEGRADDAKSVGQQTADKIAGKPVVNPHPDLADLLTRYDAAVANVVLPVREKYARRADTLLQNYSGKDMAAVLALGDVKKQIEGKASAQPVPPGNAPSPTAPPATIAEAAPAQKASTPPTASSTASTLALSGQVWKGPFGLYTFKADGVGFKSAFQEGGSAKFIWKALGSNEIEYTEVNGNGQRMNRRIWSFDAGLQTAIITDPSGKYPPFTHKRQVLPPK